MFVKFVGQRDECQNLKSANTGEGNHATGANCLWVRS